MKEEHDEDKPNLKRSSSKECKCIAAAVMLTILVVAISSILIGSSTVSNNTGYNTTTGSNTTTVSETFIEGGYYALKEQTHVWMCGNKFFPILIDGVSVKLDEKIFTPREIEQLKTLNGDSEISTYSIF